MTRTRNYFAICLVLGFLKGHPDECQIALLRRYNVGRKLHDFKKLPCFFFIKHQNLYLLHLYRQHIYLYISYIYLDVHLKHGILKTF